MPELTRRRDPDAQQETWLIHYGDARIANNGASRSTPARQLFDRRLKPRSRVVLGMAIRH
jgi:hypothetical protein